MIPGLRNATRYLYKKTGATYEQLLDMAKEAELEFTESKGVSARIKSVGVVEKTEASKLQELNKRIDTLTATLKANNLKPKSASAPGSPAKKQDDNSNQPPGSKGPEVTGPGLLGRERNLFSVIDVEDGDMDGMSVPLWET